MTEVSLELLISIGGSALAIVGLLVERFHYDAGMQERIGVLETNVKSMQVCVNDLKETKDAVVGIKTKVDLFWGALETQLPGMLLKGNPLAPDSRVARLLTKFKDNRIMDTELKELTFLLEDEIRNPEHSAGEILAMVLMNATIRSKLTVQNGQLNYNL